MFVRTTLNQFFKSRHKILVKRRKIQIKNRPISRKKLKEERQVMSISYEMKKLDIQKQIDKSKSSNHHLNQIIQDLFYPQLNYNTQQDAQLRVKQVSNQTISKQQEWEQLVQMDSLNSQIHNNSLPLQLLQLHQQKSQQFMNDHYITLMDKMNYYCLYRQKIKKQRTQNWQKLIKKIKSKNPKSKELRCPYLFLERQEITRHELWMSFVDTIKHKIESFQNIQQINMYIPVILQIHKTFHQVPGQLYQLVLNSNAKVNFEQLSNEHISNLLKLLKYKNKIKFNPNIKIQTPQGELSKQYNHAYFARKLTARVLEQPSSFTVQDLLNIFRIINSRKRKMILIQQADFPKVQTIITPILSQLNFEDVATFFTIYCTFNQKPNLDFIQIIKYDLYRKAELYKNPFYLLDLLTRFKERKIVFRVIQPKGIDPTFLSLQGQDLIIRLSQTIIKAVDTLKPQELIRILDTFFENNLTESSIIQILSTEIVKRGDNYSLQLLGKSFFKLTLLGRESKILSKYVFDKFDKKYHSEMKKYSQEEVFLLPTEQKVPLPQMNFNQIFLQECLLMVLWSINKQLGNQIESHINLTDLLGLIPIKVESADPLALQLAININSAFKSFGYFPKITCKNNNEAFPIGRLNQFYQPAFSKDTIDQLMWEQAEKTKLFKGTYNFKANKYLPERWSGLQTYNQQEYIDFCLKQQNIQEQTEGLCFFDPEVVLDRQFVLKRRRMLEQRSVQNEKSRNRRQRGSRQGKRMFYDLL